MTAATGITLYELANMRDVLDRVIADAEGELTPEIEAALDELDGKTDDKIERVALYIREQLADAERIKVEETRLHERRKQREKAADSLKQYLKAQMERLGKTKVNGILATIAIQANPPAVTCLLESDALKLHYGDVADPWPCVVEVPASYRISRDVVLASYKAGDTLPPEITVERGTHVRIR